LIRAAGIFAISLALLCAGSAQALTLQQVGGSFDQPTFVTSDPGNANRLFVVEREGTIELVEKGVTSQFADLSAEVGCAGGCQGERGLMSIALSPQFDENGRLWVDYANDVDGKIHVEELTAEPGHKTASASTLVPLLEIPHSVNTNHNGGQLQFGPDGDLYVSTGDGGGSNDELHNAQDLESPLGKILRIRPDPGGPVPHYTVPTDNPFVGVGADYAPIWSYGLRNPFRFSFDSLSGDMAIGDVGQGLREEIDLAPSPSPGTVGGRGVNYGWNCREGFIAGPETDLPPGQCALGSFTDPVFDYPHTPDPDFGGVTGRCAVIGGYVARDASLGALYGRYLYADLCTGGVRALQLPTKATGRATGDCSLGVSVASPVSFGEDSAKRLYVVEQGGHVYRLTGLPPADCPLSPPATASPAPPETASPPETPTYVGIHAERRRVQRGKMALLTVWVSPCTDRRGETVKLLRNGHADGSRTLSRACTARFTPRIRRGTAFAAITHAGRGYLAGSSRKLTIRPEVRRRRRK
jgi:hypothetical protein